MYLMLHLMTYCVVAVLLKASRRKLRAALLLHINILKLPPRDVRVGHNRDHMKHTN